MIIMFWSIIDSICMSLCTYHM